MKVYNIQWKALNENKQRKTVIANDLEQATTIALDCMYLDRVEQKEICCFSVREDSMKIDLDHLIYTLEKANYSDKEIDVICQLIDNSGLGYQMLPF